MPITVLGLDADDTLWHNETFYRLTRERFNALLADFADPDTLEVEIAATESRNLGLYGYGAKGFTLCMLETALTVSKGLVPGHVINEILAAGREMMNHPVEPFPGVHQALEELSTHYKLVLITKGDLFHQEIRPWGFLFRCRDREREEAGDVSQDLFAARHGPGACGDGRQFGALGRPAGPGSRQLCRAHPLSPCLGP
jgi:putative hydrolase of the HAD superfamily